MQANERVDQATQIAAQANQKCAMLEDRIKFMEQKLTMMMERQRGDTSTSTSQISHMVPCGEIYKRVCVAGNDPSLAESPNEDK
ncbi:hypothetical protein ACSQ67_001042 [Phaseolus vulgaris]